MLGMGSSLEPSTCSNLFSMSAAAREEVVERLVKPHTGIGMNLIRVCIGSPDFTGDDWYTYDDVQQGRTDPELRHFSIEKDRAYILPILKLARTKNPDLLFFASPWTPPGWMKTTGNMIGGQLRPEYYPAYAQYLVRFIRAYETEGVPIYAVTVQNEPGVDRSKEKDPKWHYPSCHWTAERERDFIGDHLGPALLKAGLRTQIWCYDHNYNVEPSGDSPGLSYPRTILSDSKAAQFVDGVAFHGYEGQPSGMTRFHEEFPGKPIYFTEGSVFGIDGMKNLIERLRHWASSYNAWVSMLDDRGKPNNGPFPASDAIVRLDSKTRQAVYLFEYYGYGHFMKFVQRGAVRIASTGGDKEFNHVAFRNPDGTIVLIVANTGSPAREFQVAWEINRLAARLEAKSMMTLTWRER
jgi:O-glycosyl hydrolase